MSPKASPAPGREQPVTLADLPPEDRAALLEQARVERREETTARDAANIAAQTGRVAARRAELASLSRRARVPAATRRPRARGAGRPAARRTRTATRDGPTDQAEGDGDPPPGRVPRLSFDSFRRLTLGLTGPERLELFAALPGDVQTGAWNQLRRELAGGRRWA